MCSSASWRYSTRRVTDRPSSRQPVQRDSRRARAMMQLLQQLLRVIVLRSGPQDLPPGWSTAILMVLLYVALGMWADSMLELETSFRSLFSIGLQIVAISLLLRFRGFIERLPQTITAAAGTGSLFGLCSILLLTQSSNGVLAAGVATLWLVLFIWSLMVDAHIYRSSLSITMSLGILVAVLLFALNFIVVDALFPPPADV
jgi:lysylphosphatidylglycerol synthetase-like protein (DUF2156 family)